MAAVKLSEQEIQQHLDEVNQSLEAEKQWQLVDGKLEKTFCIQKLYSSFRLDDTSSYACGKVNSSP